METCVSIKIVTDVHTYFIPNTSTTHEDKSISDLKFHFSDVEKIDSVLCFLTHIYHFIKIVFILLTDLGTVLSSSFSHSYDYSLDYEGYSWLKEQ